jgi:SNF2 family DNA or RNA helicase
VSKNIHVERVGEKIVLRGWIGSQTPGLCKSVAGARFDPERKVWRYPLDYGTCVALRGAFGDELDIGPELASWAREARAQAAMLDELASSTSAKLLNVPRYAPRIAQAMANRTYQQVGAAFGARLGSFGLFDQPGLGKTITALGSIVEAMGDTPGLHLVLCPKVAISTVWGNEIRQWLGDRAAVFELTGPRADRTALLLDALEVDASKHVFVIGNIEMARVKKNAPRADEKSLPLAERAEYPQLFTRTWDTVIVDESHRALVRGKSAANESQQRRGLTELKATRRIALSGTPMRGKPEQLWGTLNWLRPEVYTSYWQWVQRYFKLTSNGFSNYVLAGFREDGEQRLADDMRSISLRRTKGEVLPELPAKQYAGTYLIPGDDNSPHGVWLTLEGKQAAQYKRFERDAAIELDGGELIADGILAQMTRYKQFAGATLDVRGGKVTPQLPSAKFDWLVDKLTELGIVDGEGDGKIVVASQFTSLLNMFHRELNELGIAAYLLTGETSDAKRQAMVADFQATDEIRVFLLNTKAGGVAVTLDRADDLVLLDETYVPDEQEQVEDRIHRTSRMHSVTIHYLRVLDTIEEEIAYITAARENVQKYLLDGSRGVEAARQIYAAKSAA